MKFSIIALVFLFGAIQAISFEDNVDTSVVKAEKTAAQINVKEEERCENPESTTKKPKPLQLGAWCDMYLDDCQCYGKLGRCACGILGVGPCTCKEGNFITRIRKKSCPNKEEWALEDEPEPKSIPLGGSCNKDKDDCQCYGQRGYCYCGVLGCVCTVGDIDTEIRKKNCSNKEEWEVTTPVPNTLPKSKPFGSSCDKDLNDCQCHGKNTFCACSPFGCACTVGDIYTEYSKRDCPNKEEWELDTGTTEVPITLPKSIPIGGPCDKDMNDCQCYGKRGFCNCTILGCACTVGDSDIEYSKRNCPNKKEWANEDATTEVPIASMHVGGPCDKDKDDCQCFGKRGTCYCNFLGCVCSVGDIETEKRKLSCPNKHEWASDYETTTPEPKNIPLGGLCDKNKDDCQCYGKRRFCSCDSLPCRCKNGNFINEFIKRNCPNKEEWESSEITEEPTTEEPLDMSLTVRPLSV